MPTKEEVIQLTVAAHLNTITSITKGKPRTYEQWAEAWGDTPNAFHLSELRSIAFNMYDALKQEGMI